jgi:hypothetical protein
MSILTKLRSFRSATAQEAAERDKRTLASYRELLTKTAPSDEAVKSLNDAINALHLSAEDVENDEAAVTRAGELHQQLKEALPRWRELEAELGVVQIGLLRLLELDERLAAMQREHALQKALSDLATSAMNAVVEINQLRQENPRVAAAIDPATNPIPGSAERGSALLNALLAAAVAQGGSDKQKAQFLRFRNVKMLSSGGWAHPVHGVAPLATVFADQVKIDLAPAKELLPLLSLESSYH